MSAERVVTLIAAAAEMREFEDTPFYNAVADWLDSSHADEDAAVAVARAYLGETE